MVSNLKVDKIQSVAGTTTAIDISSDGTTNFAAGIPYWSISVARFVDGKPQSSFLIIPTLKKKFVSIKGKGVSFMEQPEWHAKAPNKEEYNNALKELGYESNS